MKDEDSIVQGYNSLAATLSQAMGQFLSEASQCSDADANVVRTVTAAQSYGPDYLAASLQDLGSPLMALQQSGLGLVTEASTKQELAKTKVQIQETQQKILALQSKMQGGDANQNALAEAKAKALSLKNSQQEISDNLSLSKQELAKTFPETTELINNIQAIDSDDQFKIRESTSYSELKEILRKIEGIWGVSVPMSSTNRLYHAVNKLIEIRKIRELFIYKIQENNNRQSENENKIVENNSKIESLQQKITLLESQKAQLADLANEYEKLQEQETQLNKQLEKFAAENPSINRSLSDEYSAKQLVVANPQRQITLLDSVVEPSTELITQNSMYAKQLSIQLSDTSIGFNKPPRWIVYLPDYNARFVVELRKAGDNFIFSVKLSLPTTKTTPLLEASKAIVPIEPQPINKDAMSVITKSGLFKNIPQIDKIQIVHEPNGISSLSLLVKAQELHTFFQQMYQTLNVKPTNISQVQTPKIATAPVTPLAIEAPVSSSLKQLLPKELVAANKIQMTQQGKAQFFPPELITSTIETPAPTLRSLSVSIPLGNLPPPSLKKSSPPKSVSEAKKTVENKPGQNSEEAPQASVQEEPVQHPNYETETTARKGPSSLLVGSLVGVSFAGSAEGSLLIGGALSLSNSCFGTALSKLQTAIRNAHDSALVLYQEEDITQYVLMDKLGILDSL